MEGVETVVEVWTRNLANNEIEKVRAELADPSSTRKVEGGAITTSDSTFPFGRPDPKSRATPFSQISFNALLL